MGWIEDRIIQHIYSNGESEIIIELPAKEDPPEAPEGYSYKGFAATPVDWLTKVQFEQNGRIGYKIDVGGKAIYRSATHENYEHNVGNMGSERLAEAKRQGERLELNKSVLSRACQDRVNDTQAKKIAMHKYNLNKILRG